MGLDFSRSDAHWSYSGFHRFRERLAKSIGINLDDMIGFGGKKEWSTVDDAIIPFLDHSDCDGELSPEECAVIAPRLIQIVQDWEDCYDKTNALILANDMINCSKTGTPLEFC